ncbi:MAG: HAD family hydrolase [Deltaproteobacteria bacterium]|nr:HAD family hydrolase [Deltaproteobacteria bacterium]
MGKETYAHIQEQLNQADLSAMPGLSLSVLRNIMIEPIEPYLRYHAYLMGYNAVVSFGEYDNIFQEAAGGDDRLLNRQTDCVLVFAYLDTLSPDLARGFSALNPEQAAAEVNRVQDFAEAVIRGIRAQTKGLILWHGLEISGHPNLGIWDSQIDTGQTAVIHRLNDFIRDLLRREANACFVDMNLALIRIGAGNFYDRRYWHIGRAPYTREALAEIADEDFKFIRPLKGKNKKCLVLDCDNTLWGGIIGEDGLSGIVLGKTYPGSAYSEFQREIVNLYHRGIIIALCSKNNEPDVWEVFRKHPDMILKEEHISAVRINWNDKAANLRGLASDLNIGLDSMVFLDDSEFEINLVKKELPEVAAILMPKGKAVEYRQMLASCGLFDTLTISEEDKHRGAMYKAEASRKSLLTQATDMEGYYRSLEMVVVIRLADEFSIPRIAQQTQKTNQFNLTTRRYTEADIRSFVTHPDYDVFYLDLKDRFGGSGIVGTCILKYEQDRAIIDTFLLSCRVLGRGVEEAFLSRALKRAKGQGCRTTVGEYLPTAKNGQVAEFYPKHGFTEVNPGNSAGHRVFHFDLQMEPGSEPAYFKEIVSDL